MRDPHFVDWYTGLPVRSLRELTAGEEHVKGPQDAAITIVEFSDFQCPHCAEAFPELRKLLRSRSDVRLVFRHYPLDSSCNTSLPVPLHPNACLAAIAAECAGDQRRFWEYHDVLFENHEHLERESLFRYARELGLDLPAFRACLDDPATRARVGQDVDVGNRVGVNSTPTLFINGRAVAGKLDGTYYDYALIIEKEGREAHAAKGGS
jgi:protein-disulfide isomerase